MRRYEVWKLGDYGGREVVGPSNRIVTTIDMDARVKPIERAMPIS